MTGSTSKHYQVSMVYYGCRELTARSAAHEGARVGAPDGQLHWVVVPVVPVALLPPAEALTPRWG